jgi:predicted secreted protein
MRAFLILVALGASTAALAGEPPSAADAPKPKKDKLVCINEPDVGTRIPKRSCKTQAQWDEDRREAREMLERTTRTQNNPSGS